MLELSLVNKRLQIDYQTLHDPSTTPTMLLLHYFAKRAFHKLERHNRGKETNRKTKRKKLCCNKNKRREGKKALKRMVKHLKGYVPLQKFLLSPLTKRVLLSSFKKRDLLSSLNI